MKTGKIIQIILVALLLSGAALSMEANSSDTRPYIGVQMDTSGLPDLLTKHLRLLPGQGVRIRNIQKSSPAEEIGLERDDIITRIQDQDVYKYESIVFAVQKAQVGEEISLDIIHLGERKQLKIKLGQTEGEPEWIYPPEPEIEQVWRPGRIYKPSPDGSWVEIPNDKLPQGLDITKLFSEIYTTINRDGQAITIKGNPNNEDSIVIIRDGDDKYEAALKDIDKLPEKYQKAAEEALSKARKKKQEGSLPDVPSIPQRDFENNFFPQLQPHLKFSEPPSGNSGLDQIQDQMGQLMDKIKELEKSQNELLNRLSEQQGNQKS